MKDDLNTGHLYNEDSVCCLSYVHRDVCETSYGIGTPL